ncbi:MAG: BREX-2 system phosphatase PglZ [Deltaproteobacteria bacterium]|nr:BREX-2 system phosphatase PglZ [Deltaproteobacteria bacterium]
MTAISPSPGQIRAQVEAIRERLPRKPVIALVSRGRWDGPPWIETAREKIEVFQGDSVLEIREKLSARGDDAGPMVLITAVPEHELGADVLARVARGRLIQVEPWQIVRDLFRARYVDPRLKEDSWIAEALLEHVPQGGYPPVPTGVLDAETVWRHLLGEGLGLGTGRPDLITLLTWTTDEGHLARYEKASDALRAGVRRWFAQGGGGAAAAVLDCVDAGYAAEAVSVGLACEVVFAPGAATEPLLREAAVRLERCTGHRPLERDAARGWAEASKTVLRALRSKGETLLARRFVEAADRLLKEIRADSFAYLSSVSLVGFDARRSRYAHELLALLGAKSLDPTNGLLEAGSSVMSHDEASLQPEKAEKVEMSLRLVQWLKSDKAKGGALPASLSEAARTYAVEAGFADWARRTVGAGDPLQELSAAYSRLLSRATDVREDQNRRFAELFEEWSTTSPVTSKEDGVLPVEGVLDAVVAPLALKSPVLLLVIDGMSYGVFRELLEDLLHQGWFELKDTGAPSASSRPVVATVPTTTDVSRTSLLCGRLTQGSSTDEKQGFAAHSGLRGASSSRRGPILFHKGELIAEDGVDLSPSVRDEIASGDRTVIGVVLNAVDDHLSSADQVVIRWTTRSIRLLPGLLQAAREGERVVVLASDHGHVLEAGSELRRHDQGDRWRVHEGDPGAGEVVLRGSRVAAGSGDSVVAAWSERLRYGSRKNGYHGGATPQEVVVPLAVLSASAFEADRIEGWEPAATEYPAWWEIRSQEVAAPKRQIQPSSPAERKGKPAPKGQGSLFSDLPLPSPGAGAADDWLTRVFESPTFAVQKKLAGRVLPSEDLVRQFLSILDQRGGKMTREALARHLGQPSIRIGGLVAAMQRLLNVDGYPVLSLDDASGTVELNASLLAAQFELSKGRGR